jgi:hypothetical protein
MAANDPIVPAVSLQPFTIDEIIDLVLQTERDCARALLENPSASAGAAADDER